MLFKKQDKIFQAFHPSLQNCSMCRNFLALVLPAFAFVPVSILCCLRTSAAVWCVVLALLCCLLLLLIITEKTTATEHRSRKALS